MLYFCGGFECSWANILEPSPDWEKEAQVPQIKRCKICDTHSFEDIKIGRLAIFQIINKIHYNRREEKDQ